MDCDSKKSGTYLNETLSVLAYPIAVLAYPASVLAVPASGYSYLIAGLVVLASCDECRKYLRRLSQVFLMAIKYYKTA